MATINMQTIRYINLLDKESKVKTKKCFIYNNTIFFAVHPSLVSRAIGIDGNNIKKMREHLGKKIKIIKEPRDLNDARRFIEDITSPIKFKNLNITENKLIIEAGSKQNKAALIGRNKRRFKELEKIVKEMFFLELKII